MSAERFRESEMDDAALLARIDRELRDALSVAPSPAFLPRVRRRTDEMAVSRPAWLWWLVPAAVAAGAVAMVVWPGERTASPVSRGVAGAPAVAPAPVTASSTPHPAPRTRHQRTQHPAPVRTRHQAPGTRHPAVPPEVLVPREEAIIFERFVAGLAQGRLDASAWASDAGVSGPPARIAIAPIDIKPLTPDQ